MILVFSKTYDVSTTDVMRWLHHIGERDVVRVNTDLPTQPSSITLTDERFDISVGDREIAMEEIDAVWFRKGHLSVAHLYHHVDLPDRPTLAAEIRALVARDQARVRDYFHFLLRRSTRVLGNPFNSVPNKLITLSLARSVGLRTPAFLVSDRRSSLVSALQTGARFVTKAVSDGIYLQDYGSGVGYFTYTESLSSDDVRQMGQHISPSLIQQEIEKEVELRVFYLDGTFYAAAIHSQADEKTRVDFRKYNFAKPNRVVPYKMPVDVERQLVALFRLMDLNTGSVDMIVDRRGDYFFLEINPVGQYEWISRACNYRLDRKIAEWLTGGKHEGARAAPTDGYRTSRAADVVVDDLFEAHR